MADFKTAEQYVVERLELKEAEYDRLKEWHDYENKRHVKEFEDLREELNEAYILLDSLRDFISVRKSHYFGSCIEFETIYSHKNPEAVARLMEYYGLIITDEENNYDE